MPCLGGSTELIFCDDQSTDGTAAEVRRMQRLYPRATSGCCWWIRAFLKSTNVLDLDSTRRQAIFVMILDADLTVMPEELPYFIQGIASGVAEFVNGTRLVYPIPRLAMKSANRIGNKLFGALFSYLLGQRISDTLCGTKVLWRRDWERIRPSNT